MAPRLPVGEISGRDRRFLRAQGENRKKFGLTHDVLRHAFISMFVAKFRSIGEAANQAGNSESIIRRHYRDLKNAAEAEQFWAILPQHALRDNVVSLPAHPPTLLVAV